MFINPTPSSIVKTTRGVDLTLVFAVCFGLRAGYAVYSAYGNALSFKMTIRKQMIRGILTVREKKGKLAGVSSKRNVYKGTLYSARWL